VAGDEAKEANESVGSSTQRHLLLGSVWERKKKGGAD
jgi:hypothetical protein